jgi:hypothetical protein
MTDQDSRIKAGQELQLKVFKEIDEGKDPDFTVLAGVPGMLRNNTHLLSHTFPRSLTPPPPSILLPIPSRQAFAWNQSPLKRPNNSLKMAL